MILQVAKRIANIRLTVLFFMKVQFIGITVTDGIRFAPMIS